jgi:ABC-type cobalt transport system substrate-binding protein
MKNHNFVGLVIMLLVVMAVQSIIGIAKLGYVAAKGIYNMAQPQSATITPSATYAPIFEPVNEPIEPVTQNIEPIADPWAEVITVKARKPRATKQSISKMIMEVAS